MSIDFLSRFYTEFKEFKAQNKKEIMSCGHELHKMIMTIPVLNYTKVEELMNKLADIRGWNRRKIIFVKSPIELKIAVNISHYKKENPKEVWESEEGYKEKIIELVQNNSENITFFIELWNFICFNAEHDLIILNLIKEMGLSSSFLYFTEDTLFIVENPLYIKLDEKLLLHCVDGPAMEYNDGFKVYSKNYKKLDVDTANSII